jgi:putative SOS response-associated peptidase YedK
MAARYCSSVCGRFTLASPAETIAETFELADPGEIPELAPRYNIAPTEPVAAVRVARGGDGRPGRRVLELRRWGLVPHFAEKMAGPPLFNARAETVARRPAFRDAFRRHRCLIPADGFYEWRAVSGRRQPFHLRREDRRPFALAGLYARWHPPADDARGDGDTGREPREVEPLDSCTIVTTEANALLAPIHDRMPVILPREAWEAWLDPDARDLAALEALLRPADPDGWVSYPVDPAMNRARHDEPSNVEPLFDEADARAPATPGAP